MYTSVFQGDLLKEMEQTLDNIEAMKDRNCTKKQDVEQYRYENQKLALIIKKYQDMVRKIQEESRGVFRPGMAETFSLVSGSVSRVSASGFPPKQETLQNSFFFVPSQKQTKNFHHQSFLGGHQIFVDIIKIEKFTMALSNVLKNPKQFEFALSFLNECKNVFGCWKASIFILSQQLDYDLFSRVSEDKLKYIQYYDFQDHYSAQRRSLKVISRNENEKCEHLLFKTLTKVSKDCIRKADKMATIVRQHKPGGEMTFILQIEYEEEADKTLSKFHMRRNSQTSQTHDNTFDEAKGKKKPHRFSHSDEPTFRIMCTFLQLRFEKLILQRQARIKHMMREETIQMVDRIQKLRTYKSLMRGTIFELTYFLQFEYCGILFLDKEKNMLFTISQDLETKSSDVSKEKLIDVKEEDEVEDGRVIERARKGTGVGWRRNQHKQNITDLVLNQKSIIWLPLTLGMTGMCFRQKKMFVINNFPTSSHPDFMNDVDNIIGVKKIQNVLIGYLHNDDKELNGVIQLFNHQEGPITKHQIRKFEAIKGFLGGCLENISDITECLVTMIGIKLQMEDCEKALQGALKNVDKSLAQYRNIYVPIDQSKKLLDYITNH